MDVEKFDETDFASAAKIIKVGKNMDKLLELLEKYRCHLKRDNQSMGDFLEENYSNYINDVKNVICVEDNPLLGSEVCELVEQQIPVIEENIDKLVKVFRLYEQGRIVESANKSFEVFSSMKPQMMQRYSGAFRKEIYYRIRPIAAGASFPLERRELFHIPFNKNYLVGPERYSMPGHPCLYLASQAELAWYECKKPEKFAISKFSIPQDKENYLKFIDFSEKLMPLKHSFFCWFHNETDKANLQRYFVKHICIYPLRAACSVIVEQPSSKFHEEYIVPQFLLQWVLYDEDFDGIRYESCSESEDVKCLGGHNIVLVTKSFDIDGFDIKLRACTKIGEPCVIDTISIVCDPKSEDLLKGKDIKNEPFYWNMEGVSSTYEMI